MNVCPPFITHLHGSGAADPDGHLNVFASSAVAQVVTSTALVGGNFTVPAGTIRVQARVRLPRVDYTGTAAALGGGAYSRANLLLALFRGSRIEPIAVEEITLYEMSVIGAGFPPPVLNAVPLTLAVGVSFIFPFGHGVIPLGPRRDERWSVAVLLEAMSSAGGIAGGTALAFCQTPCIEVAVA
ncbi:MAG: hypothetical protein ACTHLH_12170 [Solirubrobacterales bacterium]